MERGNLRTDENEFGRSGVVVGEVLARDFAQVRLPHEWKIGERGRAYYLNLDFEKDIEK